jgi:hypothetical protein
VIEVPTTTLHCRPCSIAGEKRCYRSDLACLNWITAREVFERLKRELLAPEDIDTLPQTD